MIYENWYTIEEADRLRGNNIVDAAEREKHAEEAMKAAKAAKEKYNKSFGSVIERENVDTPEFFVNPDCSMNPNPNFKHCSNYVEKFYVGGIIK